jgi:hypothetical protein
VFFSLPSDSRVQTNAIQLRVLHQLNGLASHSRKHHGGEIDQRALEAPHRHRNKCENVAEILVLFVGPRVGAADGTLQLGLDDLRQKRQVVADENVLRGRGIAHVEGLVDGGDFEALNAENQMELKVE